MNCYAVIDTNVFVSALLSSNENAATVQVIEKFITGEIRAIYSYSTPAYRDPEWIAELFVSDIYRTGSLRYGIFYHTFDHAILIIYRMVKNIMRALTGELFVHVTHTNFFVDIVAAV